MGVRLPQVVPIYVSNRQSFAGVSNFAPLAADASRPDQTGIQTMSIDFRVGDFFAPRTILDLRRTLERTQWLPRGELEEYQRRRLAAVLDHALTKVPYYRRLLRHLGLARSDFRDVEDLRHLPLLRKNALRQYLPSLLADDFKRYHPVLCTTSGTSGAPLRFFMDRRSNALEFVYYWRHWSWAGYRLGDRFAELSNHFFIARPHLRSRDWVYQPHLRRLVLNGLRISAQSAPRLAQGLRRYRVKYLKGLASGLYFFAHSLEERRIKDVALRAVFSTGELVTGKHRSTIEDVFSCKVLDSYGHMERTVAVSQCADGGYHINSDYGVLQLGSRRQEGAHEIGRVVGTSLYNYAMPLIRYDVEDEIELATPGTSCPCGRTLPLVSAIRGRVGDIVVTPEGEFVTALFIIPEMIPEAKFIQFHQTDASTLEVRVVPRQSLAEHTKGEIEDRVRSMIGESMEVRIWAATESDLVRGNSGKLRTVIGLGSEGKDLTPPAPAANIVGS